MFKVHFFHGVNEFHSCEPRKEETSDETTTDYMMGTHIRNVDFEDDGRVTIYFQETRWYLTMTIDDLNELFKKYIEK